MYRQQCKSCKIQHLSFCPKFSLAPKVEKDFQPWAPAFQLQLPLQYVTAPDNNKVRAPVPYRRGNTAVNTGKRLLTRHVAYILP